MGVGLGLLSGRLGGVAALELSREELEEKKRTEEIGFISRRSSYSTISTEKGRKARFTKVLRDAFG